MPFEKHRRVWRTPPLPPAPRSSFFDVLLLALACAVLAGAGVLAIAALLYGVLMVISCV